MQALHIHAGPLALAHLRAQGLRPADVAVVPAAAGGPKGLILTHLDQALFGQWLPQAPAGHELHLVGASIGAWPRPCCPTRRPVSSGWPRATSANATRPNRDAAGPAPIASAKASGPPSTPSSWPTSTAC